jgi:acyl-CoA reductase-like NAD-dependent aldehyde dehydrogenase
LELTRLLGINAGAEDDMIANLIGGRWIEPRGRKTLPVYNPASGEVIDQVPLTSGAEVEQAIVAAADSFEPWAATPIMERARLMFRYKSLLEQHLQQLAAIITRHHGKTLEEARGEVRRGIDMVDFACGAPTLMQGRTLRAVTRDRSGLLPLSARRGGRTSTVQFSGDDLPVDVSASGGSRQYVRP